MNASTVSDVKAYEMIKEGKMVYLMLPGNTWGIGLDTTSLYRSMDSLSQYKHSHLCKTLGSGREARYSKSFRQEKLLSDLLSKTKLKIHHTHGNSLTIGLRESKSKFIKRHAEQEIKELKQLIKYINTKYCFTTAAPDK